MLSRLKFSIDNLVNTMLDRLPADVIADGVFLDPAIGGGQFVKEIERRKRLAGKTDEEIARTVYGVEENVLRRDYAVNKNKLAGTYKVGEFLELDFDVKFDVVIGNPPFKGQAQLHQKYFNKSVELVKTGGSVLCVQPSTVYFNKKEDTQKHSQIVRDNINKYKTSVLFVNPRIFEEAAVYTDLAVAHLIKTPGTGTLETVTYSSGKQYSNVKLEDVTKTELDPVVYSSIVKKYKVYVKEHGSILDVTVSDPSVKKAKITSQRGNIGGDDWYTFMPAPKRFWVNHGDYGIPAATDEIVENIYDYFTLNFTRFGLAIYKFAGDMHGGAMQGVPLVPFDKKYTDKELYDMIGLTKAERKAIDSFMPDYYERYNTKI